jgi:xylulose-5-phosphate/fructose-6-phosphate phosphoketolase
VSRAYLPPDANCLLATAEHCFASKDHINLIIIDKQPQLQWLAHDEAREHCERGASIWRWASTHDAEDPDIILACAGDVATQETVAAAMWLRHRAPSLRVRVVNVVDLMTLFARDEHPHGMMTGQFEELFTNERDVVFAFHGYAGAIHMLLHGRPAASRFHVRGYKEEGTTTTPFDMVVLNETSRFHLVMEALRRARRPPPNAPQLIGDCEAILAEHTRYIREHLEDLPEIRDWVAG